MKCLYFDCFAGISGDMTLGALLNLGVPLAYLKEGLKKLNLAGYQISVSTTRRMGIAGKKVQVKLDSHGHSHRSHCTIEALIRKSSLNTHIKDLSSAIFCRLARAEAHVHQQKIADVHFHEVGAVDSIVDIVGSAICIDYLEVETFSSSALPLGSGFVRCEHGTFPVPAPATLELLKGVPVYASEATGELVTPTGAAIVTALVKTFGPPPPMTMSGVGYGAGSRDIPAIPNLLRLMLGETHSVQANEQVWVLEANIDDMNPEWSGFLMERLFAAGALDVIFIPVQMKKNRPGLLLQVICSEKQQAALLRIIFQESTTGGIRSYRTARTCLERSYGKVKTKFGVLRVKIFRDGSKDSVVPEFEECKRVALQKAVPLKEVYAEVLVAAQTGFRRISGRAS
jgi:uncharacterized protein (TIGR00299 family) protein